MKTAVIGEDADGLVVYNRALVDLARHCGFQPRACRPYRAKTKGEVGRPFRYIHEGLCHVNLNWPREVSSAQFEFMRPSQLATSGKLLLERRGACGGMRDDAGR